MGSRRGHPMGDLDRDSDSVGCQVKRYEVHETLVPIPYGSSEDTGKALISPISGDIAEAKEEEILIPPLSEETPKEEKIISPIFEDQSDLKDENLIPSLSEENLNEETQREEVIKGETPEEETLILTIYEDQPELKVIPWEDFQNTLAKFCGSDSDISQLRARREELSKKLESSLHIHNLSLHRINELEALKMKLKSRDLALENAKVALQEKSEDLAITKDKFLSSARSLFVGARSLEAAQSRLQDACKLLEGEGGKGRLSRLQSTINARRLLMVAQIAALYRIVPSVPTAANKVMQDRGSSNIDAQYVEKMDILPMTIGGLHVVAPLNMKPGLYNEPTDHEASATALGYVAHALSLLAAYLDIPLRYPLRLGASRSYIQDNAPASEPYFNGGANGTGSNLGSNRKTVTEFPLFSEGQDTTRSAYAVFLLNKDLEQVLNYLGAESVGPRHTLPNLKKIFDLVISGAGKQM